MQLQQTFTLEGKPDPQQISFFHEFGFIHYKHVFSTEQVAAMLQEIERIEQSWLSAGYQKVNGIPIKYGRDEHGRPIIQRFAFTSLYSGYLHGLLAEERMQNLKYFIGPEARLTENERDGMVVNHYVNNEDSRYTRLGWHTDGARDLFTHFRLDPMLNVGISLDDSGLHNGGLRLIPGSHRMGVFKMLFYKKYFVDNKPDKREICVETEAGDVTVHSGRLWHRVAMSPVKGITTHRRVSYVPVIAGKYKPKSEHSATPFYHRFQHLIK